MVFSTQGLGDPDAPALNALHANGRISLWIEIGNPSGKKLNKAAKAAALVRIYTYKDPQVLIRETTADSIYRKESIEVFSLPAKFLEKIAADLERDMHLSVLFNEGLLTVSWSDKSEQCELKKWSLT